MAEGGIRNALIVSGPIVKRPKGSINRGVMHVADIMPTLLEVAGASYPKTVNGQEAAAADRQVVGQDCWRARRSRRAPARTTWRGKFSATARSGRAIGSCAGNTNRMARSNGSCSTWPKMWRNAMISPPQQPDKVKALLALWDDYVRANKVILPSRVMSEGMVKKLPDRYPVEDGFPPLIYKRQFIPPTNMMADPKP